MESLLADVDTYGLGIFGDGATIVKTLVINILVTSPNNPSMSLMSLTAVSTCCIVVKRMLGLSQKYLTPHEKD